MTETSTTTEIPTQKAESTADERSHRVTATAWLAGLSAFFGFHSLSMEATLGAGIGILGIASMVTVTCYLILRQK